MYYAIWRNPLGKFIKLGEFQTEEQGEKWRRENCKGAKYNYTLITNNEFYKDIK